MNKILCFLVCLTVFTLSCFIYSQESSGPAVASATDETNESMLKQFDGKWSLKEAMIGGSPFPEEVLKTITLTMQDGGYDVRVGDVRDTGKLKVDVSKSPMTMDITGEEGPNKGKVLRCIFKIEKEKLIICYQLDGDERPTKFESEKGSTTMLATYEHAAKQEEKK